MTFFYGKSLKIKLQLNIVDFRGTQGQEGWVGRMRKPIHFIVRFSVLFYFYIMY